MFCVCGRLQGGGSVLGTCVGGGVCVSVFVVTCGGWCVFCVCSRPRSGMWVCSHLRGEMCVLCV